VNECKPLPEGAGGGGHVRADVWRDADRGPGREVQVDPIKPTLKPTGTKRLKLKCDVLLSTSASNSTCAARARGRGRRRGRGRGRLTRRQSERRGLEIGQSVDESGG